MLVPVRQGDVLAGRHRVARLFVAGTLAAALLGWSGIVRADPKTDAQALFEAGREAAKRGDCAGAINQFSRARALYPTAGSLYNIADCEERIGRLVSSRAHWTQLLGELASGDERVADAKAHVDALDRRIPTVSVVLPPGAPAGTSVELDGSPVPSEKIGVEQPIDPGQHTVIVAAPARVRGRTTVLVAEGARGFVVRGELGRPEAATSVAAPLATVKPTLTPTNETSPAVSDVGKAGAGASAWSTLAYVAGAVGVVGLASSALSAVVLLGKKSTISDHCDADKKCDDTGLGATAGVSTWSAIGTVGFGVGALGIAGFLLLPREPAKETSRNMRDASWAPRAMMISPAVAPEFVGARFAGRW